MGVRKDLFRRDPSKVLVTDFFGSVRPVEVTEFFLNITEPTILIPDDTLKPNTALKYKYVDPFPSHLFN